MKGLFCDGTADPNAKVGGEGETDGGPNTDEGTGSSAMLSSAFI